MIHEQNEKKTLPKRVICCRFRKMNCISGLMEFLGRNNRIYNQPINQNAYFLCEYLHQFFIDNIKISYQKCNSSVVLFIVKKIIEN